MEHIEGQLHFNLAQYTESDQIRQRSWRKLELLAIALSLLFVLCIIGAAIAMNGYK
jgi:hypothetical protein